MTTVVHVEAGEYLYGGALQVLFLLRGLRKRPGRHVLVCPDFSDIAHAAVDVADRVVEMPMRGDFDLPFIWRLYHLLREENADILHLHSRRGADVLGGIAARLAGVPAVLSRRVDNPEQRWQVALKYRLYDHVITISEGIRQVLINEGVPAEKVTCVHSAVDTDVYRPGGDHDWFRRQFDLANDALAVGMIAQFIPRKGHRVLVDAAPAILEKQPRARFLLFGRGPERDAIQGLVKALGLAEYFVFAGFRDDLAHVVPCLDLVAHPAFMEGLGVSLLQAAACEVPVVATPVGGIPEIVVAGQTGRLVPSGEPAALAVAVTEMLRDSEARQAYGRAARETVLNAFSTDAMIHGNERIWARVLHSEG